MATVSLCMIVRDCEEALSACLASATGAADEIIIVDTGSVDRTKETARKFTDKIYDFEWIDDFSAARNFSFSKASMDYILWLDADDVLLPPDAEKLLALKQNLPQSADVVMMRYNTGFDKRGVPVFSFFRERLVKRSRGFKWREPVHEHLEISGNIINSDICVTHTKRNRVKTDRNINIYEKLLKDGKELSTRGQYYYARELMEHKRYGEAVRSFGMFLDSGRGWREDNINACGDMAKCLLEEKRPEEAFAALLRSFRYDTPRAEICCQLGYYFIGQGNYRLAAFWFELILTLEKPKNNWGFRRSECWGYIPCIELAVCYDKLGEYDKAASYNELAAAFNPEAPAVLHNRKYFSGKLGQPRRSPRASKTGRKNKNVNA